MLERREEEVKILLVTELHPHQSLLLSVAKLLLSTSSVTLVSLSSTFLDITILLGPEAGLHGEGHQKSCPLDNTGI